MSLAELDKKLRAADTDTVLRIAGSPSTLRPWIDELKALPPAELHVQLLQWMQEAPNGLGLLLRAVAEDDAVAAHVAQALLLKLTIWNLDSAMEGDVDRVLVRAYPALQDPQREWVAERPGVAEALGLSEGRDFERTTLGNLSLYDRWPRGKPLPPTDTVEGIQARLVREGYDPGPVAGEWNARTRKALYRFQWESNHPHPGDLDDLTREWLAQD